MLNAFRHQRKKHVITSQVIQPHSACSTPFGINGRNTMGRREWRSLLEMCSTPFGINGRNTGRGPRVLRRQPIVLNAFRHQRKKHVAEKVWQTSWVWCSTPFGINGRNTRYPGA